METELAQKFATACLLAVTVFAFGALFVELSSDKMIRITGRAMILCAFAMMCLFGRHCVTRESAMVAEQRAKNMSESYVSDMVFEKNGVTMKWNRDDRSYWNAADQF